MNKSAANEECDNTDGVDELVSVFKKSSISSVLTTGNTNKEFKVIDNLIDAYEIIKKLHTFDYITFDCEGVDLGRTGALTVVSISTIEPNAIAFIFDVLVLGADIFHHNDRAETLKTLLEDPTITKISFDCRTDSDALYHQFQVKLTGCLDLQIFHQGIQRDENAHSSSDYQGRPAFVRGCKAIAPIYCSASIIRDFTVDAPHKTDMAVWRKRPLTNLQWSYAAFDVLLINSMYDKMVTRVSPSMLERIKAGSKKYEHIYRDYIHDVNINFQRHKNFIMREVPI